MIAPPRTTGTPTNLETTMKEGHPTAAYEMRRQGHMDEGLAQRRRLQELTDRGFAGVTDGAFSMPPPESSASSSMAKQDDGGKSPLENSSKPQTYDRHMAEKDKSPTRGGTVYLAAGASGTPVEILQDFLSQSGYDVGAVDGKFGNKTADALKKFQADQGLSADGLVGEQTAAKIRDLNNAGRVNLRALSGAGTPGADALADGRSDKAKSDFIDFLVSGRPTMSAHTPGGPAGPQRFDKMAGANLSSDQIEYLYGQNLITKDAYEKLKGAGDGVADNGM